jgi:hypothetical protein
MKKINYLFIVCILVYLSGLFGFSYWTSSRAKDRMLVDIDHQLSLAAKSLKYLLAPDFHDRAIDKDTITYSEELQNRKAISSLAFETKFAWLYTLAEKDGKFYFSAPTVTKDEAKQQKRWYWLAYDDIPIEFVNAFKHNKSNYVEYKDKWGTFRSIALPQTSPGGTRYLACADVDISFIDQMIRDAFWESSLTGVYFLLLVLPFVAASRYYIRRLKEAQDKLRKQSLNLENLVDERTRDLKLAKDKAEVLVQELQTALSDVKQLSGLLPICANCKKIRDDNGYWKQIEDYIDQHSEAKFSHGICPDCMKKLYPSLPTVKNKPPTPRR